MLQGFICSLLYSTNCEEVIKLPVSQLVRRPGPHIHMMVYGEGFEIHHPFLVIWGFSDQCLCSGEVLLFLRTPTTSGTSLHQVFQSLLIWLNQSLFQGPVLCQWLSQEFRSQTWLGWQLKCMPKKREWICVKVQEQLHRVVACIVGQTSLLLHIVNNGESSCPYCTECEAKDAVWIY
jgi:hypothetical protein